jgi:hypothetical protein
MKGSHDYSAVDAINSRLKLSTVCKFTPKAREISRKVFNMEQILIQIEQALNRLRLARPTQGLWIGSAATTLASTLASLESELVALQHSLNW